MHALFSRFNDDLFGFSRTPGFLHDLGRLDRIFGDLEPSISRDPPLRVPEVKLEEAAEQYKVVVELPGLSDKDVSIEFDKGVLTVKGQREPQTPEGYSSRHRERQSLNIRRSFRLGAGVDSESIEAHMKDGILTLTIPKRAESKPLQIPVRTH